VYRLLLLPLSVHTTSVEVTTTTIGGASGGVVG